MASPHPDDECDSEGSYEDDYESGDDASGVSSASESEIPTHSLAPMPEHLTLPAELHRLILSFEGQYQTVWGTYRSVCRIWRAHVESLAKTEWIRDTAFNFPGETIWDPHVGKVYLNGDFTFDSLEGDTAIFKIKDCAPQFTKALIKICKGSSAPDVEVGGIVHDVEIPEMSVDWPALTLACPWRPLIGRVMAEELRVDAERARAQRETMNIVKRMKRQGDAVVGMDAMMSMFKMVTKGIGNAYVTVRTARRGYHDREGDERLKSARWALSLRGL